MKFAQRCIGYLLYSETNRITDVEMPTALMFHTAKWDYSTPCSLCRLVRRPRSFSVRGAAQWPSAFAGSCGRSNQPALRTPDTMKLGYGKETNSKLIVPRLIRKFLVFIESEVSLLRKLISSGM
jgi:hypothetical protein